MVLALITGLTYGVTKIATMVADLPQTTKPSTSRPPRTPPATKTTPQQTQQAPAPPKPTDTPKAVPPKPTKKWKYNGTGLKDNKIYNINLPGGKGRCDAGVRTPVLSDKATVKYLKELAECTTKALKGPLAVHGFTLTVPKVKGFRKPITTPCGKLGVNGAPAFYCSGDKTIYWVLSSDEGYEAYAQTRLGYVGLFAHEYGHHLQEVTGISNAYAERWWETTKEKDQLLLSRRLELQAQCFEGVYLRYMSKMIKLTSYDKAQIREWHSYTGDEDPPASREPDHGTSEAQIRWLERGLEGANFGTCDTWSVPSKQVK